MHKNLIKKDVNMKKFTKLSLIASSAILGAALLTGCGSDSASGSSVNPVDGYVGTTTDTNATLTVTYEDNTTATFAMPTTPGELVSMTGVTDKTIITTPSNALVDADNDGNFTGEEAIGFEMKTKGKTAVVSHLTSLAVEMGDEGEALLKEAGGFDPVADTKSGMSATHQKLLIVGELVKTMAKYGNIADLADFNASTVLSEDTNVSAFSITDATSAITLTGSSADILGAAKSKADAIQKVVNILEDLYTAGVDISKLMVNVSDGGQDLTTAINNSAQEGKTVDTSTVTDLDNAINAANSSIDSANSTIGNLPAKLTLGSELVLGKTKIAVSGGKFNTTVAKDSNVSSFYDIKLPAVLMTKGFTEFDANLSVKIENDNNQSVCLTISGAQIKPNDANTSVVVTLPTSATITAKQQNLAGLQAVIGDSVTGSLNSEMVNEDLGFDLEGLLNNTSSTKITAAVEALDTYFSTSGTYDVNITLSHDANITTDYTSLIGKVTVGDVETTTTTTTTETEEEETTTGGITDTFSSYVQAVDSALNNVEKVYGDYTLKVFASGNNPSATSSSTTAIYGTLNETATNADLKLNSDYAEGTTFVIKVYDANGNLVAISESALEKATAINFGTITVN
jgi:hypothetical protein